MVTIKVNENTEEGKALLEVAKLFSKQKAGVEVINDQKVANDETMNVFKKTDENKEVIDTKDHQDLLKKLYS